MASEEKQILPEVQAYLTAREEARKAEGATRAELVTKYPQRHGWTEEAAEQREAWHSAVDAAYRARMVATNEAWNKLKSSDEPLVRWIAEHCKEFQDQATEILEALPATLDELEEIADDADWCYIWGKLRDRAVADGVIPGIEPPSPARKALFDQVNTWGDLSRNGQKRLNGLIDALVAEAKGETVTSEVAA